MTRGCRGFTLLEALVATAILGLSLTALLGAQAGAMRSEEYGANLQRATLLARGKMLDLMEEVRHDGFGEFDQSKEGDFEDEGFPRFHWRLELRKVEIPEVSSLLESGAGSGEGQSAGGLDVGGVHIDASMLAGSLGFLTDFLESSTNIDADIGIGVRSGSIVNQYRLLSVAIMFHIWHGS